MRRSIGLMAMVMLHGACVSVGSNTVQQQSESTESASEASEPARNGLEKREGLFAHYLDWQAGKVWMEIPDDLDQILYVEGLTAGLGSNPVGLDRGELGEILIVHWATSMLVSAIVRD